MRTRTLRLLLLTAAVALVTTPTAEAAPTPTYICEEMSFVGPQGFGTYCTAIPETPTPISTTAVTIEIANNGPVFTCTSAKATKKSTSLEVTARCPRP